MPTTLLSVTATAVVSYSTFSMSAPGRWRGDGDLADNGLAAPSTGGFSVRTGIHTGAVRITVDVLDGAPALEVELWDDVVEVSWEALDVVIGFDSPTMDSPDALMGLPLPAGGSQRVRVHCRGRDPDAEADTDDPGEQHLLQVWAAPPAAAVAHKLTDAVGASWRRGP